MKSKFYYGLLLLVTFLSDPVVECTECKKQTNFLTRFRIVTIEEESVMCLSYEDAVDSDKCR